MSFNDTVYNKSLIIKKEILFYILYQYYDINMNAPDLKLIHSFIVFAESKNIVEAADKLKISQPAMTAHLKAFEEQLPQKIFVMQGRKKTLNKLGLELYQQLSEKLQGVDRTIESVLLRHSNQAEATVKIGGRKEIVGRVLRDLKFAVKIEAYDYDSKTGVEKMLNSQLDLALMQERPDSLSLTTKPLFKDQFQLLIPKKMNIWASAVNKKTLSELTKLPFLSYKPDLPQLADLRKRYEITEKQNIFRTFSDWQTLVEMCEKGLGWTLAPSSFLFDKGKCDSLLISAEILPATDFYLVFPKANAKMSWFMDLTVEIKAVFN